MSGECLAQSRRMLVACKCRSGGSLSDCTRQANLCGRQPQPGADTGVVFAAMDPGGRLAELNASVEPPKPPDLRWRETGHAELAGLQESADVCCTRLCTSKSHCTRGFSGVSCVVETRRRGQEMLSRANCYSRVTYLSEESDHCEYIRCKKNRLGKNGRCCLEAIMAAHAAWRRGRGSGIPRDCAPRDATPNRSVVKREPTRRRCRPQNSQPHGMKLRWWGGE